MTTEFVPIRRTAFKWWESWLYYAAFFGVAVPLVKLLELLGQWPTLAGKSARATPDKFPPYTPTAHDVFLCSYFKSGSHWLMQIALQITYRGEANYDHLYDLVAWPDRIGPAPGFAVPLDDESPWRKAPTGLRVIKTHNAFGDIPYSPAARYISLVRDPKDVCVSGYRFIHALGLGALFPSVQQWVNWFASPNFFMPPWAEHLNGFWQARSRGDVLFLVYEDIKRDPPAAVRKIAALMGVELDQAQLDAVVARSSFAYMKGNASKLQFVKILPWATPETATVRKGESGASSELLSTEQQRQIDDYFRADLKRLACDFPYDEWFGPRELLRQQVA